MKLILTDYIASLREENELDSLIVELLKEYGFEVVFGPKKGERQYGVDIYAVGQDWEDGKKKVFLISVKQGNLDRKNWEGSPQALQPSLQNIVTVFIRNNITPLHIGLPIKIIIAHNGENDPGIQQNFRGQADLYPQYEFDIWQLGRIVNFVEQKMLNENMFSDKAKRALRKIIIHLDNPDYNLSDYTFLVDEIIGMINSDGKNKRNNINQLRKINLLLEIIISYCEKENDLRLALKSSEITLLRLWKLLGAKGKKPDKEETAEFFRVFVTRMDLHRKYLEKILPACRLKNGLGMGSRDPVSYTFAAYEQLGFIAIAGLEALQTSEMLDSDDSEVKQGFANYAGLCADSIIQLYNNNRLIFTPRADEQLIEITLAFLLLMKVGRSKDVGDLLILYSNDIGQSKMYSNLAPHFQNDIEEIFELDIDSGKRKNFDYQSSCLLAVLVEWALVINDPVIYTAYYTLIKELFEKIDLILWFPDETTEQFLYTEFAGRKSGYSLSHIELTESMEEYKQITLEEYIHNCAEGYYTCFSSDSPFWTIGAIASRHFRTYPFPYYWRQWIGNQCDYPQKTYNGN
jgi:hypothetical protein